MHCHHADRYVDQARSGEEGRRGGGSAWGDDVDDMISIQDTLGYSIPSSAGLSRSCDMVTLRTIWCIEEVSAVVHPPYPLIVLGGDGRAMPYTIE